MGASGKNLELARFLDREKLGAIHTLTNVQRFLERITMSCERRMMDDGEGQITWKTVGLRKEGGGSKEVHLMIGGLRAHGWKRTVWSLS